MRHIKSVSVPRPASMIGVPSFRSKYEENLDDLLFKRSTQ